MSTAHEPMAYRGSFDVSLAAIGHGLAGCWARTMSVMPVMHEQMHQRTGGEQQPRQRAKHMRCSPRQRIEARDKQKPSKDNASAGFPPWREHRAFRPAMHLAFRHHMPPIRAIISSSAVFFCVSVSTA